MTKSDDPLTISGKTFRRIDLGETVSVDASDISAPIDLGPAPPEGTSDDDSEELHVGLKP